MALWQSHVAGLMVAVAVGLLIGLGREKRKESGGAPLDAADVRTFALATFAIGFMAIAKVELAAGLGVGIALLLNSKSRLHTFALSQLSEQELHDATLLAGSALSFCRCCRTARLTRSVSSICRLTGGQPY